MKLCSQEYAKMFFDAGYYDKKFTAYYKASITDDGSNITYDLCNVPEISGDDTYDIDNTHLLTNLLFFVHPVTKGMTCSNVMNYPAYTDSEIVNIFLKQFPASVYSKMHDELLSGIEYNSDTNLYSAKNKRMGVVLFKNSRADVLIYHIVHNYKKQLVSKEVVESLTEQDVQKHSLYIRENFSDLEENINNIYDKIRELESELKNLK